MKIVGNNTASISTKAAMPKSRIPLSSVKLSPLESNLYNSLNNKRPLKTNHSDLAFKGLSLSMYKDLKGYTREDLSVIEKFIGKENINNLYSHLKKFESDTKLFSTEKVLDENGKEIPEKEKIFFKAKTIPLLLGEEIVYPFKKLPGVLLDAAVSGLRKIKPLSNWAENVHNKEFFKKIRRDSKMDAQVYSLRGLFEKAEEIKNLPEEKQKEIILRQSSKMFDPKTGNYDTKHERSLCRIVSGMIPAVFLANDAYNLANMCDGNSKSATKEQKIRFKQEISRVGFNAYLTLITMGALQKYMNKSKAAIIANTGITVLLTEMFSRLASGKYITMLSPEKAKAINAKKKGTPVTTNNDKKSTTTMVEKDKSQTAFAGMGKQEVKPDVKSDKTNKANKTKEKQPLMSLSTILKASAVIIATGFGIKGLRKVNLVDNVFKKVENSWADFYKKVTVNSDYTFSKEKFETIKTKLQEVGCEDLAKNYEEIAKNYIEKDGNLHLEEKDKKIAPLARFIVAPFKFTFNTVALPYHLAEKFVKVLTGEKSAPKPPKTVKTVFRQTIDKIWDEGLKKGKNYDKDKFRDYIQDSILKGFNAESMSGLANNELANLAKNAGTAATIWFLMADNYNMVMLKSNGEDVKGAQAKRKERVIQEASRLFYQTLLIDLFNSTFQTQYNNSLMGMSWITMADTTLGEILTRKSVGMPVKPHSQKELIAIEEKKENSTGFTKKYYDFMTRLTGKQSLKEQRVAKQQKAKNQTAKV
jgi:hypothetical protein